MGVIRAAGHNVAPSLRSVGAGIIGDVECFVRNGRRNGV